MWQALQTTSVADWVILGVVFAAAAGLLMSIGVLALNRPDPVRERLRRAVDAATQVAGAEPAVTEPIAAPGRSISRLLHAISAVAKPRGEEELVGLKSRLSHAGFRGRHALPAYMASQVVLCVLAGGGVLALGLLRQEPWDNAILYAVPATAIGFYLPPLFVRSRIRSRHRRINQTLPDALDLTITCVEAGIGMEAAMDRVATELGLSAPLLSDELVQTSREMRAGIARGEAFRRLARRTGVDELRSLAAVIVQTEMFGTSIAQTLRTQAETMRVRRTLLAEERAGKVGVKLTIPLVLCILPALFTVLLGPAAIGFVQILLPALAGRK